jgi:hypothetical protein
MRSQPLDFGLASDRVLDVLEPLEVDEAVDAVARGKGARVFRRSTIGVRLSAARHRAIQGH